MRVTQISITGSGEYSFLCPNCSTKVTKQAEPRTIDLLLASGVLQGDRVSVEQLERRGDRRRPITEKDIDEFVEWMDRKPEWLKNLLGET